METIADDLLHGMKEICRFTGHAEREGYYLAEKNLLPGVFKRGGKWIGLKSKIREGYAKLASGEAA